MTGRVPLVKICGLTDEIGLDAAISAGADMVGFVFFEGSPRHVTLEQAASLSATCASRARRVALTVDADDVRLDAIVATVSPDVIQVHGRETPARVEAVRRRYGVPVMRAVSVAATRDLATIASFDDVADFLLLDAPPDPSARRPGGNGSAFDWSLLRGLTTRSPWLLAGGLDPDNVASALRSTGAGGVDVSSGVERAPGVKDPPRIKAFVHAARGALDDEVGGLLP